MYPSEDDEENDDGDCEDDEDEVDCLVGELLSTVLLLVADRTQKLAS